MRGRSLRAFLVAMALLFVVAACNEQPVLPALEEEAQTIQQAEGNGPAVNQTVVQTQAHGSLNLDGSNFEIDTDANLIVNHTAPPSLDWANVTFILKPDLPSGQNDDSFGNGTKEDTAVPSVVSGSIPPNKSDLKEFGVYQERTADGGNFLHLFWSRVQDPSGTTNMDFEFNQSTTLSANGVTPVRTVDDMLITYDLSRGGTVATISVRFWQGSAWGPAQTFQNVDATGSINTSVVPALDVSTTTGPATLGPYSPRTFGEASIDLNTIFGEGECRAFGFAYLKSRASDSFTSALKDFIAPVPVSISNCGSLTIVKDAQPNHLQDFSFSTTGPSSGTAQMPASFQLDDDNGLPGADSTLPNQLTFIDLIAGTYTVTETVPTNWSLVSVMCVGGSFGNTPVSIGNGGDIPLSPEDTVTCTFTNVLQVSAITINKTDDAGNPLAGIRFDAFVDAAPTGGSRGAEDNVSAGFCVTNASGTCTISNLVLGPYWVVEDLTTVPAGYTPVGPQHVNLTSATEPVTLNLSNPRQHRVIVIVCHEGTNTLYSSDVTLNGNTSASIGTVPAHLAAKGVTQADLCGTGGASFGGLGHGTVAPSVNILAH